jgi:molybdenum cofactor cytidylyltransferase
MNSGISAVILSSGLSERMGQPKALLKWDGRTTFIEKIISEFSNAGCDRIICMINKITEPYCKELQVPGNVKFVVNHHPDWGRFYSVRTGLRELGESPYCMVHNVDNPFVNDVIIDKLIVMKKPGTWCSPVYKGKGGHPVLLSRVIITRIIENEDLNTILADILNDFPKISVEMNNDLILRNVNTPEDFNNYFR